MSRATASRRGLALARGRNGALWGATLCALVLVACGGSARDAEREPPPDDEPVPTFEDEGNRVPGVFEFPEGGRALTAGVRVSAGPPTIDRTGALWLPACGGLLVINDGQARFYDAASSDFPEPLGPITVDANNRKWLSNLATEGSELGVFERGRYRTVLSSAAHIATAASGVVWAAYPDGVGELPTLREVAPTLGEPLPLPPLGADIWLGLITDHDGGLWLTALGATGRSVHHWLDGAWSGPIALTSPNLLYDVTQDVLWSFGTEYGRDIHRVRWTGDGVEERPERGIETAQAELVGVVADGLQVWRVADELIWTDDGVEQKAIAIPDDIDWASVSWNSDVYLGTRRDVYRLDGAELARVAKLSGFLQACPQPGR